MVFIKSQDKLVIYTFYSVICYYEVEEIDHWGTVYCISRLYPFHIYAFHISCAHEPTWRKAEVTIPSDFTRPTNFELVIIPDNFTFQNGASGQIRTDTKSG